MMCMKVLLLGIETKKKPHFRIMQKLFNWRLLTLVSLKD